MKKPDIILIGILLVASIYLWTLPFQDNHLPFGEGDGAMHFVLGDHNRLEGHSYFWLPSYINLWYYNHENELLGGRESPFYPPQYHLNQGIFQLFSGERVVPVFLYIAFTSFLVVFAVYFLLAKLYGPLTAFLAGLGITFSIRDIMVYLWGQRPTTASFMFIPIILYAFYRYYGSISAGERKPIYLYVTVLLLSGQFLFHLQGFAISVIVIAVYVIFQSLIKKRFVIINKNNYKHLIISGVAFLGIVLFFSPIYFGTSNVDFNEDGSNVGRLFTWFDTKDSSYPAGNFSYDTVYGNFMFIFLGAGIIYLLLRRKDSDILLLSWLVGMYIILHLDVVGYAGKARIDRMIVAEAYLFYSIMAIGVVRFVSVFKMNKTIKNVAKYSLILVFIILSISFQGNKAYSTLNDAYQGISRITPVQQEAALWLKENVDTKDIIYNLGTLTYPKNQWMLALSNRHVHQFKGEIFEGFYNRSIYFMMDYSDLRHLRNMPNYQKQIEELKSFEQEQFGNSTPLYDKNDIRVYYYGIPN